MTPGSRYVQLLTRNQPNYNNGTVAGGLAHMLQQGLAGYAARQDQQQQMEAQKALAEGLMAKPWTNPDTGQTAPGTEGGLQGAARALSGLGDNPYATPLSAELLMQQARMQAEADARRQQFELEQRYNPPKTREVNRGNEIVTQDWNPQTQTYEEVGAAPRWQPQAPQTVKTAEGVFVLNPDGTRGNRIGGSADAPTGPLRGTGMDAQVYNILLTGDPSSPVYAMAYNYASQPKVQVDPATGGIVTISPDMNAFRPPMGQQPAPQQPAPQMATPQPAQTVQQVPGATITTTPGQATKFNEGQGKAAGFADRMASANAILDETQSEGTDFWARQAEMLPQGVGNFFQSDQYRSFEQARRDFINAQLRRESGAVISPEEFDNAEKQYFPQPGDDAKTIEQKRRARQIAIQAMQRDAGPAYKAPEQQEKGGIKIIRGDEDYNRLPSGTSFRAPDGTIRVKP